MIMYENLNMIECGGVSCYIVKGKNGDVLIDTGREQYRDHIETWLMNYNVKLIIPSAILPQSLPQILL